MLQIKFPPLSAKNVSSSVNLPITSLGGVGKTQIALEYAYRYGCEYNAVFWARADSSLALISSMIGLAQILDLPERDEQDHRIIVNVVLCWLRINSRWLLLSFCNVEHLSVAEPFLPKEGIGHLIFTTRMHTLSGIAQRLEIQKIRPDTGALLLLRRTAILQPQDMLEHTTVSDRKDAGEIA